MAKSEVSGACPLGVTESELESLLGDRLTEFWKWMTGQTVALCDGREYDHAQREYHATECAPDGHGTVVYRSDLNRFIRGLPVID